MADIFSRQERTFDPQGNKLSPVGTYPRFMEGRLINGDGNPISWKKLFTAPKSKRMEDFFVRNRKQKLAKAVSVTFTQPKITELANCVPLRNLRTNITIKRRPSTKEKFKF